MPDRHRLSRALATLTAVDLDPGGRPIRYVFREILTGRTLVFDPKREGSQGMPIGEVADGEWDRLVPDIQERTPAVGVVYECRLKGGMAPRIAMRRASAAEVVAARRAGRW